MTEDEAKTKWCAHSNAAENPTKCDGSACMAWRWDGHIDRVNGKLIQGLLDIAEHASDKDVVAVGYCGLAGKP